MIRAGLALGATLAVSGCGDGTPEAHPTASTVPLPPAPVVPAEATTRPALPVLAEAPIPSGTLLLVFEFPDGIRGGRGRIQGHSQWPGPSSNTNELVLAQLQECGAVEPRLVELRTHASHVLSRSTPRNRDIVACFKQRTFRHFNAATAIYNSDPRQFLRLDTAAFHEFEDEPRDRR